MEEVYYHSIGYDNHTVDRFESIIKMQKIISLDQMDKETYRIASSEMVGFNGLSYISVARRFDGGCLETSCYKMYIKNAVGFIIDGTIPSFSTKTIHPMIEYDQDFFNQYNGSDNIERYSDIEGEYQIYRCITFDKIKGIFFPLTMLRVGMVWPDIKKNLYGVSEAIQELDVNLPLIDLETNKTFSKELLKEKRLY